MNKTISKLLISLFLLIPINSTAQDNQLLLAMLSYEGNIEPLNEKKDITIYMKRNDNLLKNRFKIDTADDLDKRNHTGCYDYFCDFERLLIKTQKVVRNFKEKLTIKKTFNNDELTNEASQKIEKAGHRISLLKEITSGIKIDSILNPTIVIETKIILSDNSRIMFTIDANSGGQNFAVMYSRTISLFE